MPSCIVCMCVGLTSLRANLGRANKNSFVPPLSVKPLINLLRKYNQSQYTTEKHS